MAQASPDFMNRGTEVSENGLGHTVVLILLFFFPSDLKRWAGVAVLPLVPLLSVRMRGEGALQPPSLLLLLVESCRLIDQPQRTVPRWNTSVFYVCSPACTTQVRTQHISSTQIPSESLLQNNPSRCEVTTFITRLYTNLS